MKGFNVGNIMSMEDMELAKDYLNNKETYENELEQVKKKVSNNLVNTDDKEEMSPADLGENVTFERYRRITGFLVPDIARWNKGKRQELKDRTINRI